MKYLDRQNSKDTAFGLFAIQALLMAFSILLGGESSILNFLLILPLSIGFVVYLSIAEGSEILFYKGVPLRIYWFLSLALADLSMVLVSLLKLWHQPLWFFISKLVVYVLYFVIQIIKTKTLVHRLGQRSVYWIVYALSNLLSGIILLSTIGWFSTFALQYGFDPIYLNIMTWGFGLVQLCMLLFGVLNRSYFDMDYRFHRVFDIYSQFLLLFIPVWSLVALFFLS